MSDGHTLTRAALALASTVGLGLSACDSVPPPLAPAATDAAAVSSPAAQRSLGAAVNRDLAALRRLTAPFHNFDKAVAAGRSGGRAIFRSVSRCGEACTATGCGEPSEVAVGRR